MPNISATVAASASRLRPVAKESDEAEEFEALLDRVRDTNAALREVLRTAVARHGLLPTEYRALAQVARGRARTPSRLSRVLGITPASTTELIDRLERRGWSRRVPNPEDRRSALLELTAAGLRLYRSARAEYRRSVYPTLRAMTATGRAKLAAGLSEFSGALDEQLGLSAEPGRSRPGRASEARD